MSVTQTEGGTLITGEDINVFARLSAIAHLKLATKGLKPRKGLLGQIRKSYGLKSRTAKAMLNEMTENDNRP